MVVEKTIEIDKEHLIEFGKSSWDENIESIRRRKNNKDGTFDPFSSSEIPINGGFIYISELVCVCLKYDKISKEDITKILLDISDSVRRQGIVIP